MTRQLPTERSLPIPPRPRSARLGDICRIQPGYARYRQLPPALLGEGVPAIRLQDVSPAGLADPRVLARLGWAGTTSGRYFVRPGEVIFRPRGDRNTAVLVDDRFREPALVIVPLLILRPTSHLILSDFLAWTINQPPAQRHFDRVARGTNMRMVPKPGIENLTIDLPELGVQRRIVAVDELARRERTLVLRAAEQRREIATRLLGELATAASGTAGPPSVHGDFRYIFGMPDPKRAPRSGRTAHGPADIN